MIATTEVMEILERTDRLTEMILQSAPVENYRRAHHELENNEESQRLIHAFLNMKDHYEDVQRFGHYHPDYQMIMKEVRSTKRKMDMNQAVSAFKIEERKLQQFLDEVSEYLAHSVSEHIMVPKDGLALTDGGCASGSCGTGGSCGCQAS